MGCEHFFPDWRLPCGRSVLPGERYCQAHHPKTREERRRQERHRRILESQPYPSCASCAASTDLRVFEPKRGDPIILCRRCRDRKAQEVQ